MDLTKRTVHALAGYQSLSFLPDDRERTLTLGSLLPLYIQGIPVKPCSRPAVCYVRPFVEQ